MKVPGLNVTTNNVQDVLWYLQQLRQKSTGEVTGEIKKPPPVKRVDKSPSRLFALIIGINEYIDTGVKNLCGAVLDARDMRQFLVSRLGVAEDRIIMLLDREATRDAIISAFKRLAIDSAIHPSDPILIYYAGHGAEVPFPNQLLAKDLAASDEHGKIQMLLPHDFLKEPGRPDASNLDMKGQGILDITLSLHLARIATNKSDNITVIFDCCHSGSGTRDEDQSAVRGVKLPEGYTIPSWVLAAEKRATAISPGFEKKGLQSHVLLAACQPGQEAREGLVGNGLIRGAFTSALLRLFQAEQVDQLTARDVINRLSEVDLGRQNPQCEGVNQDRILFDSKVAANARQLFRVSFVHGLRRFKIEAGEAYGISKSSEFAVYSDETLASYLGSIVVELILPFESHAIYKENTTQFKLSGTGYAVQTHRKEDIDIRFLIEPNQAFLGLFDRVRKEMNKAGGQKDATQQGFRLVNSRKEMPYIALRATDTEMVEFEIMEPTCKNNNLTHMPFNNVKASDVELLYRILEGAANFYRKLHLGISNRKADMHRIQKDALQIECIKLVSTGEYKADLYEVVIPHPDKKNYCKDMKITLDLSDDGAQYGYKITNTSDIPLFASLFYFDASDLSIVPYFKHPTVIDGKGEKSRDEPKPAPSLPENGKGSLTIGFGDTGTVPHEYFLRDNQKVDVGFLKLYVSNRYVDFSWVEQDSPFGPLSPVPGNAKASHGKSPRAGSSSDVEQHWKTLVIPVIQKFGA